MKSLWDENEVKNIKDDELALRVYTSRLLGREPSLVLHGGGNTSVKISEPDIFGNTQEILYVKGSGWDLATIEKPGFAPVRLEHLCRLAELKELSDPQMVNELKSNMTNASAPTPSVEAILHAILPYKYVDHTHADAIVTITNTDGGEDRIREIYGDEMVIIPYVMPGFDLARLAAELFKKNSNDKTVGMILLNHGIFSFGATARESYERMIELVNRAEEYLKKKNAWELPGASKTKSAAEASIKSDELINLADLRLSVSQAAGAPMLLKSDRAEIVNHFVNHPQLATIAAQGPATPDHVIRTKRLPQIGRDVESFVTAYRKYFDEYSTRAKGAISILDPAPRVILDQELGLISVGKSADAAGIVNDIYRHTIEIILRSTGLGGFRALPANDIFDVEYWDLEQAKLRKGGSPPIFSGEVAMVTGAASGIGLATVKSLLKRGAAVVGLDIAHGVKDIHTGSNYLGIVCDVNSEPEVMEAINQTLLNYGGIDMLILNAGMFPGGKKIADMEQELWRSVLGLNLDANLNFMREIYPFMKRSPNGGRVVVVGSKNVPAPGPGAAAYSASKAALTQLARIAALEWGQDNIRINVLHPDAVFDTGIWTEEVLAARAKHYGLTVKEYKTKNVLKTEVKSSDVAELAAEMCGPLFAKTTGAQLPVDGGNERVI